MVKNQKEASKMRISDFAAMSCGMYAYPQNGSSTVTPGSSFNSGSVFDADDSTGEPDSTSNLKSDFLDLSTDFSHDFSPQVPASSEPSDETVSNRSQLQDSFAADAASAADETERASAADEPQGSNEEAWRAEESGAVTADERKQVLNSYTSYLQNAIASSSLNLLV